MCNSSSRCSRFATLSGLVAMAFMQSIPAWNILGFVTAVTAPIRAEVSPISSIHCLKPGLLSSAPTSRSAFPYVVLSTILHLIIMPTYHPPLLKPSQGKTYSPRPKCGPGGRQIILSIIPPISAVWFNFESLLYMLHRLPHMVLPLNQSAQPYSTKSDLRTWRLEHNKPGKNHTRITPSESTITPGLHIFSVLPGGNICRRLSSTFSCRPEHLLPFS